MHKSAIHRPTTTELGNHRSSLITYGRYWRRSQCESDPDGDGIAFWLAVNVLCVRRGRYLLSLCIWCDPLYLSCAYVKLLQTVTMVLSLHTSLRFGQYIVRCWPGPLQKAELLYCTRPQPTHSSTYITTRRVGRYLLTSRADFVTRLYTISISVEVSRR